MTDPVILLGTQSNGETLPVQVDGFGRLVAEGLQGPEGPPGPGGTGELPPDPYEGALLGWLNGELSWVGTPPVPIPPGVFGPITAWDAQSGLVTVEGEIPAAVGGGVYVWQCNADGTYFTEGWNTSQVWSDATISGTGSINPAYPLTNVFNGSTAENANSLCYISGAGNIQFVLSNLPAAAPVTIVGYGPNSAGGVLFVNGVDVSSNITSSAQYFTLNNIGNVKPDGTLTISFANTNGGADNFVSLNYIEVNGQSLVDTDESLNLRVNTVMGQSLLGVSSAAVDFTIGKYLRVPEQRVAPWVLYGNDPTSLIDHLRSS